MYFGWLERGQWAPFGAVLAAGLLAWSVAAATGEPEPFGETPESAPPGTSDDPGGHSPRPSPTSPKHVEDPKADPPMPETSIDLPVHVRRLRQIPEVKAFAVRNLIAMTQIWSAIRGSGDGLALDLSGVTALLDGRTVDPGKIYGRAYLGPYPFEAAETGFAYKRFRRVLEVAGGKATLDVGYFLASPYNSEGWIDRGSLALRLELFLETPGRDLPLGVYNTFVGFLRTEDGYRRLPWIVEGPFVHRLTSDEPGRAIVGFLTDQPAEATLVLGDGRQFRSGPGRSHTIEAEPLEPGRRYSYRVRTGDLTTKTYRFRAAPAPGAGPVTFAYCGDMREGVGGGTQNHMGVNSDVMGRLAAVAYLRGAEFFLIGGDLINGYTTSKPDFEGQLYAWKQAISGFWHERAVYPGMGNHEALLRVFRRKVLGRRWLPVRVDRWPYASHSAEAVFAGAFLNPENAPRPADPRKPPYRGSVFSFQYGMVKLIAFNNNYWYSSLPGQFGGSPEGYIFEDQLQWIEQQLRQAEGDSTVRYVVLFGQEPVFPCGGHIDDAMWWEGDNGVRAYTFSEGKLRPEKQGMLEVRNRLARAVAGSHKVAAVLGGDEHAYYRVRIDREVPVGDPAKDDRDGNGRIAWLEDESASPLADLKHPTWFVTCGGGGAPYYSEEPTPWNRYWQRQADPRKGYLYSSQENVLIFRAEEEGISLRVYNPYGELIDEVPNLMAIKQ